MTMMMLLPLLASILSTVCSQSCSVGVQFEETYAPSYLVKRYQIYVYTKFPLDDVGFTEYAASSATGLAVIIVFGLLICCGCNCCNCYIYRKLQREEQRFVEKINKREQMSAEYIDAEEMQMDYCHNIPILRQYSFRQHAYFALVILFLGCAGLTGYAIYIEPNQTNAVKDIPLVLAEVQTFISDSLIPAINCTIGELDAIDSQLDNLNISTNDTSYVSTIKTATESIRIPLRTAMGSLNETAALAQTNQDWVQPITDELASANTWLVRVLFGVLFLIAFWAIVVAWQTGKVTHHTTQNWADAVAESTGHGKKRGTTVVHHAWKLTCFSHFFMFMVFIAFIGAAVFNFFTIITVGFCEDPEALLLRYTELNNVTDHDQRMQYYAQCKGFSLLDQETNWIWDSEKQEAKVAFQTMLTAANVLRTKYSAESFYTSVENTRDTTVGVLGTLSDDGLLGCQHFEYFYELATNDFCKDWFDTTARMQELLLLYCLGLILIEVCLFILRREEPDYDIYHQTHDEADDDETDVDDRSTATSKRDHRLPRGDKKLNHQQRASLNRQLTAMKKSNQQLAKAAMTFKVGDSVQVEGYNGSGVVRFAGLHNTASKGFRVGVEFEKQIGKNNGTVGQHSYFKCAKSHGVLVVPQKVSKVVVVHQHKHMKQHGASIEPPATPTKVTYI